MRPEDAWHMGHGQARPGLRSAVDWYVAYTKPQLEGSVAEGLARIGVENYLPLIRILVKRHRKRRTIERPFFPGYLFSASTSFDRRDIDGLRGFLSNGGSPVKVAASVVDEIRSRVLSGEFNVRQRNRFAVGAKVMITAGAFKGTIGEVETATSKRADVLIELLSRRVSASIGIDQLEMVP